MSTATIIIEPVDDAAPGETASEAFRWLKLERESVHGSMRTWREETLETFHRDLGLLVDFVTREDGR